MKCSVQAVILVLFSFLHALGQTSIIKDITDTSFWYTGNYDGAVSSGSLSDQGYLISIENPGPQTWSIQFTQNGVNIDSGKIYQFSFIASSNESRTIVTSIGQDGGDYLPYSKRDTILLTSSPQLFEYAFVMKHQTDTNARIEFNCGVQTGNILFSDVKLIESHKPVMQLKTPESGVCIHEGTEIEITWSCIGNENPVKIEFSRNNGLNWEIIDSGIPDTGFYKWLPSGIYSPWCLLRVSAENENTKLEDTSGVFEIAPQTELVYNGTFTENIEGWKFDVYNGSASLSIFNGESKIEIESSGTEKWHIQYIQDSLFLQKNVTYVLSYTAYSEIKDSILVEVNRSEAPHESFMDSSRSKCFLTTEPKQFSAEITTKDNYGLARIEFNCGLSNSVVFIDNVSLAKKYSTRSIHSLIKTRSKTKKHFPSAIISVDRNGLQKINRKHLLFDLTGRSVIRSNRILQRKNLKVSPGIYLSVPEKNDRRIPE